VIPKDADLLVTINAAMDLGELARASRRLKGSAQTINLGEMLGEASHANGLGTGFREPWESPKCYLPPALSACIILRIAPRPQRRSCGSRRAAQRTAVDVVGDALATGRRPTRRPR